jgi:hypothetical protein
VPERKATLSGSNLVSGSKGTGGLGEGVVERRHPKFHSIQELGDKVEREKPINRDC